MRYVRVIASLTAAVMLWGTVPAVQAGYGDDSFTDGNVSGEDTADQTEENVEALVKAASDANPDYTVTVSDTGISEFYKESGNTKEWSTITVAMLEGSGGYAVISEYTRSETSFGGVGGSSLYVINPDGKIIIENGGLGDNYLFDHGIISLYPTMEGDWSTPGEFYDLEGNPLFEHPDDYSNHAMVNDIAFAENDKHLLINEKGETVLELPEGFVHWDSNEEWNGDITHYSDGLIGFCSYKTYGDTIFDLVGENESGLCGYMDLEGNIVIPQQFDSVSMFHDGLAAVGIFDEENDSYTYGFIDKTGAYAIPLQFEDVSYFSEGYAAVKKNGLYGYIDKAGEFAIPLEYEAVDDFHDEYAYAVKDGNYGYIDKNNHTVIPFEYDEAFGVREGMFTVCKDGKWGMVDKNNEIIVPMIFKDITIADNGIAFAVFDGKLYRLELSFDGEETLAPGDLNGDNEINSSDAAAILMASAAMGSGGDSGLTEAQLAAADLNDDGEINATDAAIILAYAAAKGAGEDVELSDFI